VDVSSLDEAASLSFLSPLSEVRTGSDEFLDTFGPIIGLRRIWVAARLGIDRHDRLVKTSIESPRRVPAFHQFHW
jgi:hypothetical protein